MRDLLQVLSSTAVNQSVDRRAVLSGLASTAFSGAVLAQSERRIVYEETFGEPGHMWLNGLARNEDGTDAYYAELPIETDGVTTFAPSRGRYWLDYNHISPGAGYLSLLAVNFAKNNGISRFFRGNHEISGGGHGKLPMGPYNLVGKSFTFRCRAKSLGIGKKTRIGLWVQYLDPRAARGEGRMINVFQVQNLICEQLGYKRPLLRSQDPTIISTEWTNCEVPISSNPLDWVCLGSRPEKSDWYGCSDDNIRGLMSWQINLGVVALHGEPVDRPISGEMQFAKIALTE